MRAKPDVSRFSLREEGEVAWLKSPNGLGATARYQYAGEWRTNLSRFSAVGPDLLENLGLKSRTSIRFFDDVLFCPTDEQSVVSR